MTSVSGSLNAEANICAGPKGMKAKVTMGGSDGRAFQAEGKAHDGAQRQEAHPVVLTEQVLCGQSVASGRRAEAVSESCSGWEQRQEEGGKKKAQGQGKRLGPGGEEPRSAAVKTWEVGRK